MALARTLKPSKIGLNKTCDDSKSRATINHSKPTQTNKAIQTQKKAINATIISIHVNISISKRKWVPTIKC